MPSTYSIFIQSGSCSDAVTNHSGCFQHIFSLFPTYLLLKQRFIVLHIIQGCFARSHYFTLKVAARKRGDKEQSILCAVLHNRSRCSGSACEWNLIFFVLFPVLVWFLAAGQHSNPWLPSLFYFTPVHFMQIIIVQWEVGGRIWGREGGVGGGNFYGSFCWGGLLVFSHVTLIHFASSPLHSRAVCLFFCLLKFNSLQTVRVYFLPPNL